MSNTYAKATAREIVVACAELGNKIVSFTGGAGLTATTGFIDKTINSIGLDVPVGDRRNVAALLVEDVGTPSRGDTVTDEDGADWTLTEELDHDDAWVAYWSVEPA